MFDNPTNCKMKAAFEQKWNNEVQSKDVRIFMAKQGMFVSIHLKFSSQIEV